MPISTKKPNTLLEGAQTLVMVPAERWAQVEHLIDDGPTVIGKVRGRSTGVAGIGGLNAHR